MGTATVTSTYGGRRIDGLIKAAGRTNVLVGVLRGTGVHPKAEGDQTIAEIAWWDEFGTKLIPERSFLRSTLREHKYYREDMKKALRAAILDFRHKSGLLWLKKVGAIAARDIRRRITTGPFKPNAPRTIRAKSTNEARDNKQKPLIDTGTLRKSIQFQIEGASGA
jgi:hypothetical protein